MIYPLKSPDFDDTAIAFSHHSDARLKKAYWLFCIMNNAWLVRTGIFLTKLAFKLRLPVKPLIRHTVFQHFCGGETIAQCRETIQKLGKKGVGTILDYSVEGKESESAFDHTLQRLLDTVETAAGDKNIPFAVFKVTGLAGTVLLEKFQRQEALLPAEKEQLARARRRIHLLCQKAYESGVRIFFDAEESWIQGAIDRLCYEMMALFNKEKAIVYNTFQFYRRDMSDRYKEAFTKAGESGYFLGAKLVRGAYLEKERLQAEEHQYPDPIHASKEATDSAYNEAVRFSLAKISRVAICLGTHNEES
ncbi:MAG: proline dehydrogenase, partial [Cytophagaceae bacterium SCN 52-12]